MAGIAVNCLIIIVVKLFESLSIPYREQIINYSTIMIVFNLIPIIPLDGSRILKTLLEMIFDTEYAKEICQTLSFILIVLLGFFFFVFHKWLYIIIIIYLLMANIKEKKSAFSKLYNRIYLLKSINID